MTIKLYDLAGADPSVRFSPYCWRARLSLAHKGLAVETIPWRFTDKAAIAFSGQATVPIIRDGDAIVHDSLAIADYLDATYPDRPTLIEGAQGRALTNFARFYAQATLTPVIVKAILLDLLHALDPKDKDYFRTSRESRFGMTMEQFVVPAPQAFEQMTVALAPLQALLKEQPFVNGERPAFADYCVFGTFMWARCASDITLVAAGSPVESWLLRMLDLYDGLARRAPRAHAA